MNKISPLFPQDLQWISSSPLPNDLDPYFFYFNEGSQSYVFVSKQGYILKFFKQNKFMSKHWPYKKRIKKRISLFNGYKIASELFREESGIVIVHLVPNSGLSKEVSLIDAQGALFHIDLGKFEFILQKFSFLIATILERLMTEQKEDEAKELLAKVFRFLKKRINQKILDLDPDLLFNLGVNDKGEITQIDPGKFRLALSENQIKENILLIRKKNRLSFEPWLQKNFPTLLPYYLQNLEDLEKT